MDLVKTKLNKWFIAVKKRGKDIFDLSDLLDIPSPKDTYFADPFLFKYKGENYIFFEHYNYEKGRIAFIKIEEGGIIEPIPCLEKEYHLSFPCIFEKNGNIYMTPENGKGITVYRAQNFPFDWKPVSKVADGVWGDPVLTYFDGYWRVFATNPDNHITLFRAKDLTDRWEIYHSEDALYSRGAGQLFELNAGKLIRPTQDCNPYGRAIVFREIENGKDGRIVHKIEPDWYPNLTGTHTFNFNEDYVVIDGRIKL